MDTGTDDLTRRLREGFERIAAVLRADQWSATAAAGLNPIQAQVLSLLACRQAGLRAGEIASHLGVSPASLTDTLAALGRKRLISRAVASGQARVVSITASGRAAYRSIAESDSRLLTALAGLAEEDRTALLRLQIRTIRALQTAGAIPFQRLCVTCRHFRPHAHPGAAEPHHCAFMNAALADRTLRLDCGDHEPAGPQDQSANWLAFDQGR